MSVYVSAHVRGRKRVLDSLELELQVVVILSVWMLESKLGFSARAASVRKCWAIDPVPHFLLFSACVRACACGRRVEGVGRQLGGFCFPFHPAGSGDRIHVTRLSSTLPFPPRHLTSPVVVLWQSYHTSYLQSFCLGKESKPMEWNLMLMKAESSSVGVTKVVSHSGTGWSPRCDRTIIPQASNFSASLFLYTGSTPAVWVLVSLQTSLVQFQHSVWE